MIYWVSVYLSFAVVIAAVISLLRFGSIDKMYLPFVLCIWIAAANEILSFAISQYGYSNIPNNNIYIVLEALLILWQFKKWRLLNRHTFLIVSGFLIAIWLFEVHSRYGLNSLHYYYRIVYAAIIIFFSISFNNKLIISHHNKVVTNPGFIICTGYILYFTIKMVSDAWWLYNPKSSTVFLTAVFVAMVGINFITNILFILAILWMPRKPDYITF